MNPPRIRPKHITENRQKRLLRERRTPVQVDLARILSIDHACKGCAKVEKCCCAKYEVCVDTAELKQIIQVLPEAAKFCHHLKTAKGYDNVFEKVEKGLYAIDTNEKGLCVFAFMSGHTIRCSLHTAALTLGLPIVKVKPKACLLWPLSSSDGDEFLSLASDALSFRCNSRRRNPSRRLSPALSETIGLIYGKDFRTQLEKKACEGGRLSPTRVTLRPHESP